MKKVIIDIGSKNIKGGLEGDEINEIKIIPNLVCKLNLPKMIGVEKKDYYSGNAIKKEKQLQYRDSGNNNFNSFTKFESSFPMKRGKIIDWDNFEKVLYNTFYNELLIGAPEEYDVLISEPLIYNNQQEQEKQRSKYCEILFESLNIQNISIMNKSILSYYSSLNYCWCN